MTPRQGILLEESSPPPKILKLLLLRYVAPAGQGFSFARVLEKRCPGNAGGERALQKYLWIAIGGALGALARYSVGSAVAGRLGTKFPYGTFVVNLTACVLLGFSLEILARYVEINPAWRYLIPTGFVGAYSTFSTFEWETFVSLQAGSFAMAGAYAVSSVVLGLVGVWCGVMAARIIP